MGKEIVARLTLDAQLRKSPSSFWNSASKRR
jgi:hypothetical protein